MEKESKQRMKEINKEERNIEIKEGKIKGNKREIKKINT